MENMKKIKHKKKPLDMYNVKMMEVKIQIQIQSN